MALSSKTSTLAAGEGTIRAAFGVALMTAPVVTNATAVGGGLLAMGWHPMAAATCAVLAWVLPLVAGAALMAPLAARLTGWRA